MIIHSTHKCCLKVFFFFHTILINKLHSWNLSLRAVNFSLISCTILDFSFLFSELVTTHLSITFLVKDACLAQIWQKHFFRYLRRQNVL